MTTTFSTGTTVTHVNLSALSSAMSRAVVQIQTNLSNLGRDLAAWAANVQAAMNAPRVVEGLAARYRVRAALDPTYATPDAVMALTARIMRASTADAVVFLTRENRAYVAASALTGWCRYHDLPRPPEFTFAGLVRHDVRRTHTFTVRAAS